MVRTYKRKTEKEKQYSPEDLAAAVEEVKAERMCPYRASKEYKVPLSTLTDHIKGRRGVKSKSHGRPTVFSEEVEKGIAAGLEDMERYGFALSRQKVLSLVEEFVIRNNLKTPFKNYKPSFDWLYNFMKRNNLSIKKPKSVEIASKNCMDPFVTHTYFNKLERTLKDLGLEHKPHLIYNLDETSFATDSSKTKVAGLPSLRSTSFSGEDNIVVLLTISASGDKLPPLIIFKEQSMLDEWQAPAEAFPGLVYAATPNGSMESDVFEQFFEETFLPFLREERPALLICNGHKTHVSLKLMELARQENITIIILPAHSSHLFLPLDLSVMKSLKNVWDVELVKWQKEHIGQKLPRKDFVMIISSLWKDLDPSVIKSGFRKGGIYPFSREIIPESMFDSSRLHLWKAVHSQEIVQDHSMSTGAPDHKLGIQIYPKRQDCCSNLATSQEAPSSQNSAASSIAMQPRLHFEASTRLRSKDASYSGQPSSFEESSTSCEGADHSKSTTKAYNKPGKTFREFLLDSIQNHKVPEQKKTKVVMGSEVITLDEIPKRLLGLKEKKEMENLKGSKELKLKSINNSQQRKGNKRKINESSSESDYENDDYSVDLDKMEDRGQFGKNKCEGEEKAFSFKIIDDLAVGDWAILKFFGKKRIKYFVGEVLNFENGEPIFKYVRKTASSRDSTTFKPPSTEYISSVEKCDVVFILPPPERGTHGELTFHTDISNYNIQ